MKTDDIKDKIIEMTRTLLIKQGTVTIKEIADLSYTNIASVNYHFGSKENLLGIITENAIDELKKHVIQILLNKKEEHSKRDVLESVIDYIYTYCIENIGIVSYLFLSKDFQATSSNILIDTFFSENEFTRFIYQEVGLSSDLLNEAQIKARYLVLFSSFALPLFISISKLQNNSKDTLLNNPEFKKYFIEELLRIAN